MTTLPRLLGAAIVMAALSCSSVALADSRAGLSAGAAPVSAEEAPSSAPRKSAEAPDNRWGTQNETNRIGNLPEGGIRQAKFAWPSMWERALSDEITLDEALTMLRDKKVDSVVLRMGENGYLIHVRSTEGHLSYFRTVDFTEGREFSKRTREAGVPQRNGSMGLFEFMTTGFAVFMQMLFLLILLAFAIHALSSGRRFFISPMQKANSPKDKVTFNDVAGQESAKEQMRDVVEYLRDPDRHKAIGARVPRGILLDGDPGNGKTLLARAVAGEADVPFFFMSGSDFVEMLVGLGTRRVKSTFKELRRHKAAVLFIDEIDAVGGKRNGNDMGGHNEREQTLNALLVEMDGMERAGNIVVLAATNRLDILDSGLTRPGRFDRKVHVPAPDLKGRLAILRVHARKLKLDDESILEEVAKGTPGFSGAALANLLNEAAILAGKAKRASIANEDVRNALDNALMGPPRLGLTVTPEEKKATAWHEAGHALVAMMTPGADPVRRASIVPRERSLGVVIQMPDRDQTTFSVDWARGRLDILMAGRAAEEKLLGSTGITSGASMDIEMATKLAREMLGRWGMNPEIGLINVLSHKPGLVSTPEASQETLAVLDREVAKEVSAAMERAKTLLDTHAPLLASIADALMARGTLNEEDLAALLQEYQAATAAPVSMGQQAAA